MRGNFLEIAITTTHQLLPSADDYFQIWLTLNSMCFSIYTEYFMFNIKHKNHKTDHTLISKLDYISMSLLQIGCHYLM